MRKVGKEGILQWFSREKVFLSTSLERATLLQHFLEDEKYSNTTAYYSATCSRYIIIFTVAASDTISKYLIWEGLEQCDIIIQTPGDHSYRHV